jgi:hypothetical protein
MFHPVITLLSNPYVSLNQHVCVHATLCTCMMVEYHMATYSWGLHTDHMLCFWIDLPFLVKPDPDSSLLVISISSLTISIVS